jgi:hypothetical protein
MTITSVSTAEMKPPKLRWFQPTPGRLLAVLLAVEGLLWLSERLGSPEWHKGYAVLVAIACVGVALLVMFLWFIAALCFRWRFQFSLRALLVLTVAVAVPCSWMAVEMKRAREHKIVAEELGKHGVWVLVDYPSSLPYRAPPEPNWLRKVLGDDFFSRSHCMIASTDATDARLKELAAVLTPVTQLNLENRHVTDRGIEHLKGLVELRCLVLNDTQLTDDGLEHLKGLSQLQVLSLDNTRVTDSGLIHLKALAHLQSLYLQRTHVTEGGVKELQQALPNCTVVR